MLANHMLIKEKECIWIRKWNTCLQLVVTCLEFEMLSNFHYFYRYNNSCTPSTQEIYWKKAERKIRKGETRQNCKREVGWGSQTERINWWSPKAKPVFEQKRSPAPVWWAEARGRLCSLHTHAWKCEKTIERRTGDQRYGGCQCDKKFNGICLFQVKRS